MPIEIDRARNCLKSCDFKLLLIEELGWDHYSTQLEISVDSQNYVLEAVAEKKGMVIFLCLNPDDKNIPTYPVRRKVERQVAKSVHEHVIIYLDDNRTTQIWQWVKRELGKPTACREHTFHVNQPGDSLIQKLQTLAFSLEEEENLTIVDVAGRTRSAFDVEKVTKKFYDRFKTEHDAFLKFINGIPDEEMFRWYTSVMLNRLMFIYFIQKKGFLNDDDNYLRNKLSQCQQSGKDHFYKAFICPLFFEGFAKKEDERSEEMNHLLGKIPYLNGGLFLKHQLEELYGEQIEITDNAFDRLFDFFDLYQWYLDERPLRADNEINPDVLGYIFEKYINQKQMGAYYTKEDITEYISKNTVIPFLFDAARQKCKIAFEGEQSVWRLLQNDPDRYIYDAPKKGIELPLPAEIAAGLTDVSQRTEWNKPAPPEYALPTEIWREVIARRQRHKEVKTKLLNGEIKSINDLITYNLDIRQFAQDVIENCEGPELLRAFYHAIENVTVLDPTCGSGAFLFAALNILEPLYEACLDRMEVFLDDLGRSGEKHRADKYGDFRKILKRIEEHPNRRYFILKSIIINNLFGVDIMEEAVEICKLRLFLKLVAQVDEVDKIEPLPDIDFNIRAGNTLVGFATYEDVQKTLSSKLFSGDILKRVEEQAEEIDSLFDIFRQMQTEQGMDSKDFAEAKEEVYKRLRTLEDELNRYLAEEYGVDLKKKTEYQKWLRSYKPFHWFIEFYGILKDGGFDVIIGNPPYVEYSKVKGNYTVKADQYRVFDTTNLYPLVIERSLSIIQTFGNFGMIVPLSAFCTQRMTPLVHIVQEFTGTKWISHFGWRPATIFNGVNIPVSIVLLNSKRSNEIYTTTFNKWYGDYRQALLSNVQYVSSKEFLRIPFVIPKVGNSIERSILHKIITDKKAIRNYQADGIDKPAILYYRNTGGLYWRIITDFQPLFELNGNIISSSTESTIAIKNNFLLSYITAVLNSNLFWFYYVVFSSFHHVNPIDILSFPIDFDRMNETTKDALAKANYILMQDLQQKSKIQLREHKGGNKSRAQTFYPSLSKDSVNKIDHILKEHYDLTIEELDYVINYDIKFRLSSVNEEDKDGV